jgi:RNA polymerase sigma factor (sigma-70 family)
MTKGPAELNRRAELLYHFCRLQLPAVELSAATCQHHLQRTFKLHQSKSGNGVAWTDYLDHLYPADWFVASACLEGKEAAWQQLFAARAGRTDCLLVDALRARAVRLYPRDEERQESAVNEFWSQLYVAESPGSLPVLARYDGQRPLVPWLIRVFQNWHISLLRKRAGVQVLPEDELALPLPAEAESRWHELFCSAAQAWLADCKENELLILGLRLRYRLSQREVAHVLGVHEGTISRQIDSLREDCLNAVGQRLVAEGWTGDDVSTLVQTELQNVILDDPRLSADALGKMLSKRGKKLP